MSAEVPGVVPIPAEPPKLEARVSAVAFYLLAGAIVFFFISFVFAFLYLRALNTNGLWGGGKPGQHVQPSLGVGIGVLVCVLASVALVHLGLRHWSRWRVLAGAALALGLAAVGLQCWQYTFLGFGPGDGGYASVYLGWTGFFAIVAFGVMVWLEMQLASAAAPREELVGDARGLSLVWTVLGLVEITAFVLLYVVQ